MDIRYLVFQYKEEDSKTGIGLFLGIDKRFIPFEDKVAVFDSYYNKLFVVENTANSIQGEKDNIVTEALSLEPTYYFIGGEIKTVDGKQGGNFKIPLIARNYKPDSLYTSDLMFAEKIERAEDERGLVEGEIVWLDATNGGLQPST